MIGHLRNIHPFEFLLAERLSTFLSSGFLRSRNETPFYVSNKCPFLILDNVLEFIKNNSIRCVEKYTTEKEALVNCA